MQDENFDIVTDLIAPKSFDINAPKDIEAELYDTIKINKDTTLIWYGFIQEINRTSIGTTLTVIHPLMALDIPIRVWNSIAENLQYIGYQAYANIYNNFASNERQITKFPLVYWAGGGAYTNWTGEPLYVNEVMSAMDMIIGIEKQYNYYLRWGFYTTGANIGKISFAFYPASEEVHLDISENFVINKTIELNTAGGKNIALIYFKTGEQLRYQARCIIDGEFIIDGSTHRRNEIDAPRVVVEDWTDRELTDGSISQRLKELLPINADEMQIKVQVPYSNNIVNIWRDGQRFVLHDGDKTYNASLTGRRISGNIVELTFGTVRSNLTDKLNAERK